MFLAAHAAADFLDRRRAAADIMTSAHSSTASLLRVLYHVGWVVRGVYFNQRYQAMVCVW